MNTDRCSIPADRALSILNTANIAVRVYAPKILAFRRLDHIFNDADLEDIASACAEKACKSYDKYDPAKAKLSTWVTNIAINCVKDEIDRKLRHLDTFRPLATWTDDTLEEADFEDFADSCGGKVPEIREMLSEQEADREIQFKEFQAQLDEARASLGEKDIRFERLMEMELKSGEIAAIVGCTPNAAYKRIHLIRQAMAARLNAA